MVLFYGFLFASGTSIAQARSIGLLLQPFPAGGLWRPFTLSDFNGVDWHALLRNIDKLIPVPLVSLIAFLLNATGLELVAKRDINLNHELRITGLANFVSAVGGGPPGYHMLGATALAQRMGAKTRIVTITAAAVCGLILFAGGFFFLCLNGPLRSAFFFLFSFFFLIF